jgi:single-strand DNA-binding protein
MAKYLSKGALIAVDGRIQSRNYQAQDGTTRTSVEVVADTVQFLESRSEGSKMQSQPKPAASKEQTIDLNKNMEESKTIDISNDDLP